MTSITQLRVCQNAHHSGCCPFKKQGCPYDHSDRKHCKKKRNKYMTTHGVCSCVNHDLQSLFEGCGKFNNKECHYSFNSQCCPLNELGCCPYNHKTTRTQNCHNKRTWKVCTCVNAELSDIFNNISNSNDLPEWIHSIASLFNQNQNSE